MNEKCPKCGSNMVETTGGIIYDTYPQCWDRILWCACGHTENREVVYGETSEEILMGRYGQMARSQ